ncbi:uncharacterized protein A4U43_C07F36340 [Asparagus officinalis]|uniref:F-box domain-containing protein n=1 Tax=Asparagus officinalis TaxID=4686 RepID=A0A5P1EHY9_ASPOF|nr:F-box/LRR-repeat protein 15-like [Asparagus officinalis]XP_020273024.1 F-box/LRR-repeat protein 15-like [Asparagus officinalis]XP_020273025.1 F-box/LRR-repeat protein 15-like [Asparagus officinalis]ONK65363.1 uncharacterized protein A4U43_C07F36340 [Asparagus officinalis]
MEDNRSKAVVNAHSESEEEEEVSEAEAKGLELDLALGRSPCAPGSSSTAAQRIQGSLFPFELAVGSFNLVRDVPPTGKQGKDLRIGLERDRDYKRLKLFRLTGITEHCSSDNEASAPLVSWDLNCPQASLIPSDTISSGKSRDQAAAGSELSMNSNDGGVDDGKKPNASNAEDIEIRMDLTEDLLHLVFSFLSQKDLCKAGATCKQWQVASMHEDFWRCLNFEDTEISEHNFESICQRYPSANRVNLSGVYNSDVLATEAITSLRRLETLVLGNGQLGDGFFHALTDCPALNSLTICDASLGNGIQDIAINHDILRELNIVKCRVLRISVRCSQLQTLSLRRSSMAHLVLTCPQLHELDLSSCHKLSDAGIRAAAITCSLLASLDLSSCSCVSDETLREIAFACPSLSLLDASYCPNISLESVRLPMLMDLKLHSCEGITSASMSAVSYSRMLESLQLDNCGLLTSVILDLPHLRSISLVHCRKFVDLNLRCPVLSYIKVSNCSALLRINITSHALQKLILQKQERLSTLSLQCHNLREVDLSDCESLTNAICEVFSNGGGCPMLRSLALDNCERLTAVGLRNSSLVSLSLVGCHAMTVLDLSCPGLLTVNLDGCDHLEKASFCPVGLESLNLGICPKLSVLQIEAPKMSVLELKGCGVLARASISCPSLVALDASFCRQLLDDSLAMTSASCPMIESLVLSSCLSIGVDGLSSLHSLQYLTLLDLSYTFLTNLQPIFDTCSQLVILKLSACKFLSDSSLDALYKEGALPALRELDLSYSSIGQSAILGLLASCGNLVNVNLNGCANMHDLVWGSSNCHSKEIIADIYPSNLVSLRSEDECFRKTEHLLETLNCIGCPNIKKFTVTSSACCFHLSKLNLNLSANLKEVDLACFNLNSLNLSHCCSLEILKLDCPRLMNLQLLACTMLSEEALEVAISRCNMLEVINVHSCPKIHAAYLDRLRFVCRSLKRIQSSLSA